MSDQLTVIKPEPSSVEGLIVKAIEHGVSVETMERLLVMRRELKSEAAKESYDKAMAQFQSACPTIRKTKEVKTKSGAVAYRYAPIESIVEQVKHLLQAHGFSYTAGMELVDGGVKVAVKVTHAAGHSESSHMHVPFGEKTQIMSNTQVAAAAQTFAKRYAFCNAFGILTGDEDTDATEPAQPQRHQAPAPTPKQAPPPALPPDPVVAPAPGSMKHKAPLPERIAILKRRLGSEERVAWTVGYLRSHRPDGRDDNAALLPNEGLESLTDEQVDVIANGWLSFMTRIEEFINDNAEQVMGEHNISDAEWDKLSPAGREQLGHRPDARPSGSPIEEEPVAPVIESPAPEQVDSDEWFFDIVVPVPRRGMKRDTYLKDPDTIRSLHDARHDDDEARRRLFGFIEHYEPSGWEKRDGTKMPPNEGDIKFREALDAYSAWFSKNHPDEKL